LILHHGGFQRVGQLPTQLRGEAQQERLVHKIALRTVWQPETASRHALDLMSIPIEDASRQKNSPPGFNTRHVARSIASK
jgi:hypothetical protein